jgi:hypothetical protein
MAIAGIPPMRPLIRNYRISDDIDDNVRSYFNYIRDAAGRGPDPYSELQKAEAARMAEVFMRLMVDQHGRQEVDDGINRFVVQNNIRQLGPGGVPGN